MSDSLLPHQVGKVREIMIFCSFTYLVHYFVGPMNSTTEFVGHFFIMVLDLYMFFSTFTLCIRNINILTSLPRLFELLNIPVPHEPILKRVIMYVIFGIYFCIYYAANFTEQILILVHAFTTKRKYWFEGLESFIMLIIYFTITLTFHPYFFNERFRQLHRILAVVSFFVIV